jgi:virulence factor Mce-like protein
MSPVRAGLIAVVIIAIGSWFAFSKDIPFTQTYRVQAVFENSNLVAPRSPVRIAGFDVGKVVEVTRYGETELALVTMEITDEGRPVREDATMKIRPRLFLEGNFYVDLHPGTPAADELADGGMIPVAQTAIPVQLDQVLTALQSDTRRGLQGTLVGLGDALNSEPTAEEDARLDPDVQGLTGAQAINKSFETSVGALRGSAISGEALRGTQPRDLSRLIEGIAGTSRGLGRSEAALRELLTDFNATMAATASRAPELREAVRLLGPTAGNLRRGLASVNEALPPTQAFAREILPGVRETPATAAAAEPWLAQATPFFGPRELGGLLDDLTPATRDLASVTHTSRDLVPETELLSRCATEVFIPTGNIKVDDGEFSVDVENYKEFFYGAVAQAGEGQGFDGNGPLLRLSTPNGALRVTSGRTNYQNLPLVGDLTSPPRRTSPAFPRTPPPLNRKRPCHRNPIPDVNGPSSVGPADGSRPNAPRPPVPPVEVGAVGNLARLVPIGSLATEDAR